MFALSLDALRSRRARKSRNRSTGGPVRSDPYHRRCRLERLEDRSLLSTVLNPLEPTTISGTTGEKPQSKVWSYADAWFSVFAHDSAMWLARLDGLAWTSVLRLTSGSFLADVKAVGDVAHILLEKDAGSKLVSVEYVPGSPGTYEFWSQRPSLVNVSLASSTETATLDVDSTGRMWIASDATTSIEVRYSDAPYSNWSGPITVASGIDSDDISTITAMPNHTMGVLWSNQTTERFGFRTHRDGDPAGQWSADEVPAASSALNVGNGMADDHVHVAVASDGTLYAAVKTSYDSSGYAKIALLVRRPSGNWDPLYTVDTAGTRPIVVLSEAQNRLLIAYRNTDTSGPIVYRESPLSSIAFGSRQTLIPGTALNNVSSTKQNFTEKVVLIAAGNGVLAGVLLSSTGVQNQPPNVYAGADQTIFGGQAAVLDATVSDDGLPSPPNLLTNWTMSSGPSGGVVTFGNAAAVDTTASFSKIGQYVLRLTANDGQRTSYDDVMVTVLQPLENQPPVVDAGPDQTIFASEIASLDATVSDDGLPSPSTLTTTWSLTPDRPAAWSRSAMPRPSTPRPRSTSPANIAWS